MKNLKIGSKLILSFGIVIILFLITVAVALLGQSTTANNLNTFYTGGYQITNLTKEMQRGVQAACKNIGYAVMSSDQANTEKYIGEAEAELNILPANFDRLYAEFNGDITLVDKSFAAINSSKEYREQIFALLRVMKNSEASDLFFKKYMPPLVEAQQYLTEINVLAGKGADFQMSEATKARTSTTVMMAVCAGVALILTLILATYIVKSLTKPISEIKEAANKLAAGDLDATITYKSKDELGQLSESMRSLVNIIKGIIQDMSFGLAAFGDGDFAVDSKVPELYVGDFQTLRKSMYQIIQKLTRTLSQIGEASEQVASGSDQVSGGAQALSQGATEQASSVEELAATVTEISDQVRTNAANSQQANQKATKTGDEIMSSNLQMQEMMVAMKEISDSSGEIGKIIKTIEDIAFQTNILALNAAVEAARAGAAGKGFAVVADEVRNLASKSAEASKNTSALIENSLRSVEGGTRIADETAKSLLIAVEGAKEVAKIIDLISKASGEQAMSIAQVTQGIDQISSVVQTNSATAEESAAASEELSSQAQLLKTLVGQFHLNEAVINGSSHISASA